MWNFYRSPINVFVLWLLGYDCEIFFKNQFCDLKCERQQLSSILAATTALTRPSNSAIHKAAGVTAHGRSEPKHPITHAHSCEKNGAGRCEITVPLSVFPYPFFSTQKSRRTERPPGVILYGSFASFSVPIGWISHVITHSNMASSLEKMDIVGFNNFEESINMGNITASWPALGSLEKLKPKYIYYSYADLQYRKRFEASEAHKGQTRSFLCTWSQ